MTEPDDDEGAEERLATRTLGESGPRVVFVHGLFGQGRNWTTIGKGLAESHRVTLIDLPNHGHSPWTDRVDYLDMVELLATELEQFGEPVTLVGHSMGGKVSMQLALHRPELLRALVVVDIAPVAYPPTGGRTEDPDEEASPFAAFIEAMRDARSRCAADPGRGRPGAEARRPQPDGPQLPAAEPGAGGARDQPFTGADGGWRWRLNLDLLARDLDELRGFPPPPPGASFDGPVLWIAGANSHYVLPGTVRTWTRCSRAPGWCGSRTPGTGCTPSSRRPSSRRCGASSPPWRADLPALA